MLPNSDDSGYQNNSDDSGYQEGIGDDSDSATPGRPEGTSLSTSSGANGSSTLGKQVARSNSPPPPNSTLGRDFLSPPVSSTILGTALPSPSTHTPDPHHHPAQNINIQAPLITGNNVTGHDASSRDRMQEIKDAIKSRIKATKELKGTWKAAEDLDEFFMEMYVMGSDFDQVNNKHEIWQVETAHFSNNIEGSVLQYYEIFKPGDMSFKNVLTKGIAGIGKTITVKKYLRDWAEERHMDHIDFDFVFLLPFRDLNRFKDKERSLLELIHFFYPELKEAGSEDIFKGKLLFIFDGLDESQVNVNVDITTTPDVSTSLSMDVLLTSLMTGKLLPSARLWITTRPAATGRLPDEVLTQCCVTQIQGFNDEQKEEYFKKEVKDEEKAGEIISHLKSYRSLYIMCHIPLFCWMAVCVLKSCTTDTFAEFPKSLTEMYIHFVITQTCFSYAKYKRTEAPHRSAVLKAFVLNS
ncbi:NLR family CARD domain-containing protein 3-like [Engraulis encrasicolus]|uniref:NLR family CARD domain-containing protein 3-like n=1 Tax=Engraulis encrasicolus TaxID=184585 RepID=UPI002FD43169